MQFAFTEEQSLIRDSARSFFDEHATSEKLRAAIETQQGYDSALWVHMAEMGWAAIAIPEAYGGAGLSMVELAILQHEQGRRLVATPFFTTVCLAANLINEVAGEDQKAKWLPKIAAGELRIAVARADLTEPNLTEQKLTGEDKFVIYGNACDALLIIADDALYAIEPTRTGVTIESQVMLDLTRPMSRVLLNDVLVTEQDLLGTSSEGIARAIDLARIALAAESVGSAERILEFTTDYTKERIQFGRPIASFQAIKHRLADMMVAVEAARSAWWYAATVAHEIEDEVPEAASIAKAACSDAFYRCAANAIQLHGGIGFTWEHDAHLYFKRARASSTLLGSPAWHRERLARFIGLGETPVTPAY